MWEVLYERGHTTRKFLGLLDGYWRRIRVVRDARHADLVYLFLEALPLGPVILERLIHRAGVPIVYDLDDLIYTPHSSSANPVMLTVRKFRGSRKVRALFKLASQVIVTNDHLAKFAERSNPNVTKIWPSLDTLQYPVRSHHPSTRDVVVGWSGSHSTSHYLLLLTDVLRDLQESDAIKVRVIGDSSFAMPGVDVEAMPWRLATEVEDLSQIDIGLNPWPHSEWILGKTGGKVILYMAVGIPVIAQRIGSNLEIINHGRNGFLAETRDEWLEAIRRLVRDPALREQVGKAGRETIVQEYSVQANKSRYLKVIRAAINSRRIGGIVRPC
jgi:glycosyltransferase involved in cell wall biosynthesis